MKCRHCNKSLQHPFADLGTAPPSNAYLPRGQLSVPERFYPLRVLVCDECWLVQTVDTAHESEYFNAEYAYYSSFSTSWIQHAEAYVKAMVQRFALDSSSQVVEVAANDGYLLQFVKGLGIPCVGVEPTHGTATVARGKGIPVIEEFFGESIAGQMRSQGLAADLMVANNVLAHVPDINDFVAGFARLLKPGGVATFEFPHLLCLIRDQQFDTIYHEHFSYLSLTAVKRIFEANGLSIFDVEELTTHGGSLRVFAQQQGSGLRSIEPAVERLLYSERGFGLDTLECYTGFQAKIEATKDAFLSFLLDAKASGKQVAAYGAAAKGNTFLNFAGIRSDLIAYVVDRNPVKQGKYMPGSRIPIVDESRITESAPDYLVILPWNLRSEIVDQLAFIREWGGQFVVAIPNLSIVS